jgi:hypothetical protein
VVPTRTPLSPVCSIALYCDERCVYGALCCVLCSLFTARAPVAVSTDRVREAFRCSCWFGVICRNTCASPTPFGRALRRWSQNTKDCCALFCCLRERC